ncbi:MAG: type II toxin-antitoxin system RatA family toxin [Halioglobus sp.]|nr:type II toxin-antitoxin system RatA family toxin [Halioglobus sp.]
MTVINRSALLPYSARQLFDLVSDVESYPRFMEGCVGAHILRSDEGVLEARLDLARGGIKQSFSTRNRMHAAREITLELLDGPFDNFTGRWDFHALGDSACKMSLYLEFKFNSSLLGAAASRLFDKVTNNLVDAVSRRATQLYG